ncbi:MAG: serine/threonine-protein kinase [Dokdonella sp.]
MTDPKLPTRELFEVALTLAPPERAAYLTQNCADARQRAAIERMLAADADGAARVLDGPFDVLLGRVGETEAELALPRGTTIGPFSVLDKLGEGGSSIVFRATREQAGVTQTVALKLLRRGLYSNEEQRRFRSERLALAQLRHPGIARLIEGGVTDTGVPYIALELIDGHPITDYAREHQLDMRQRLQLFVAVCRAVEAAHRALIVHRDLKPSNVLVTPEGDVKLLDFGIAKLLDAELDGDVTHTQHHAMTPAYAAPEQFSHGAITTATDVYSLGILLGELTTGSRREQGDSHTPSSRISEDSTPGVLPAPPKVTRRQLRGDLDNIVMKATAGDPERRYASAGAFADDIERHLAGQPVAAHPPSTWYRARKFVARHKGGVLTTFAFLLAIFAALGAALWQATIARQQAQLARAQAERADATRQFLVGVFDQAEPDANLGKPIAAQQLLNQGEQQLSASTEFQPGTRLDLTVLLAHLYWDLGDYAHAEPLLKQAAAVVSEAGISDEVRARTLMTIASVESEKRKFDDALGHAKQALEVAERAGRVGIDSASEARRIIARTLHGQDNSKSAEPIMRAALASDRAIYGDRHAAVADDLYELGTELTELSLFDEAKETLQRAVDTARAVHGPVHSSVANGLQALAEVLNYSGDYDGSERVDREALGVYEKIYGPEHRETLIQRSNLYTAIEARGGAEEGLQGRLQMMHAVEKLSDARPELSAAAYSNIGGDYLRLGRFDEAEAALRRTLAVWAKLQGSNDAWDSADPMKTLAIVLRWNGKYAEAEATMRHAIHIEEQHEPPSSGWLNRDRGNLGDILRFEHRYDDALAEVRAAANARRGAKPDPLLCGLLANLSQAELDTGDAAKAQATATESVAMARKLLPPRHLELGPPLFALARADLALGRAAEAEPLLREVIAVRSPPFPANDPRVLEAQVALANALDALGRGDESNKVRAAIGPALRASHLPYAVDLLARLAKAPPGIH